MCFLSCDSNSKNSNVKETITKSSPEDIEIYNLVFNDRVKSGKAQREILKFYFGLPTVANYFISKDVKKDKVYYNELKYVNEMNNRIDTSKLFIRISNKFLKVSDVSDISEIIDNDNFRHNFINISNEFIPILKELNTKSTVIYLSTHSIKPNENIQILSNVQILAEEQEALYIGEVSFSNIAYNEMKTLACVYFQLVCGGHCGGGEIIFLQKENSKWKIIAEKNLWVS